MGITPVMGSALLPRLRVPCALVLCLAAGIGAYFGCPAWGVDAMLVIAAGLGVPEARALAGRVRDATKAAVEALRKKPALKASEDEDRA